MLGVIEAIFASMPVPDWPGCVVVVVAGLELEVEVVVVRGELVVVEMGGVLVLVEGALVRVWAKGSA